MLKKKLPGMIAFLLLGILSLTACARPTEEPPETPGAEEEGGWTPAPNGESLPEVWEKFETRLECVDEEGRICQAKAPQGANAPSITIVVPEQKVHTFGEIRPVSITQTQKEQAFATASPFESVKPLASFEVQDAEREVILNFDPPITLLVVYSPE